MDKEKKIEQFKRELRSYNFYKEALKECNDKLEAVSTSLCGVSSPKLSASNKGGGGNKNYRIYDLMDQEEKLIRERNMYRYSINQVEERLSKLSEKEQKLLIKLFVNNANYEVVAREMYCSRAKLFYDVNKIISKII